jgi:N-formylglutamate amidohydrolase
MSSPAWPAWPAWAVCHLPADSAIIPAEVLPWLRLSAAELAEELAQRTSHRTGDLFARGLADHQIVRASCSPLVVDVTVPPEGYASQQRLSYGTGVAATGVETLVVAPACRALTPAEQTMLLDGYYHPHQAWFAARVALKVAAHGRCLVVNALSFAPTDMAFAVDESLSPLPDIRLGAHAAHTPERLLKTFEAALLGHAWRVQLATAHPAAMVPRLQEGTDRRVHCLSIEVNRALYWDHVKGRPSAAYEDFRDRFAAALGAAFSRLD